MQKDLADPSIALDARHPEHPEDTEHPRRPEFDPPIVIEDSDTSPMPVPSQRSDTPEAVYGQHYYDSYSGGAYEYEGHWKEWFGQLADQIIRQFNPRTVLDAGCAKGFLVRALRERGVEAYGFDTSEYAIASAGDEIRDHVWVGSILEPLDRRYDLITCIEVIEHLQPDELHQAVEVLCAATDRVLLSSTGEGGHLGEPSHFSMRPPEDWAALFATKGFLRKLAVDVTWLTPWASLYERQLVLDPAEVVREYDRQHTRLVREVYELRQTSVRLEGELNEVDDRELIELRARVAQLEEQATAQEAELEVRQDRIAGVRTELLRTRDLLITKTRELGNARGQIESLQDQIRSFQGIVEHYHAVVNSTTWRVAWKALAPLRERQTRRRSSP